MGVVLGIILIFALYYTVFCVCRYKNIDDVLDALNEAKKDIESKEQCDK